MKTEEELNELKEEVENLNKKLSELTEDELKQVTGGAGSITFGKDGQEIDNCTFKKNDSVVSGGALHLDMTDMRTM